MNKLETLIRKLISNTATEQDQEELRELLDNDANRRRLDSILDKQFELPREEKDGLTRQESAYVIENILASTKKTSAKKQQFMIATVATVTVAALGAWLFSHDPDDQITPAQEETATYIGKDHVRLPDGTAVLLNTNTELSYSFTENRREVTLNGEAYFDVAHDPSKPFIVHTGKVSTQVLGTAFNVKAYPEQNIIFVGVTRGKVQVGDAQRTYAILTPNELLSVNTTNDKFVKSNLDTNVTLAWKENFLVLDEVTMEEAAAMIGKKYGVEIRFNNPNLKKCGIYAKFLNNESLADVLDVVSIAVGVKYTLTENGAVVQISGKGCD